MGRTRRKQPDDTLSQFVDRLRRDSASEESASTEREHLLVAFSLNDEEYGVPIREVREILRVPAVSRVPQAPPHVRGVINVRGQIVPVVEIRSCLGLDPLQVTPGSRVLLVEVGDRVVGLLVDGVSQVLRVPESAITGGEDMAASSSEHVQALAQLNSRLIILLDIAKTLQLEAA